MVVDSFVGGARAAGQVRPSNPSRKSWNDCRISLATHDGGGDSSDVTADYFCVGGYNQPTTRLLGHQCMALHSYFLQDGSIDRSTSQQQWYLSGEQAGRFATKREGGRLVVLLLLPIVCSSVWHQSIRPPSLSPSLERGRLTTYREWKESSKLAPVLSLVPFHPWMPACMDASKTRIKTVSPFDRCWRRANGRATATVYVILPVPIPRTNDWLELFENII